MSEAKCNHLIEIHTYRGMPMLCVEADASEYQEEFLSFDYCPKCGTKLKEDQDE